MRTDVRPPGAGTSDIKDSGSESSTIACAHDWFVRRILKERRKRGHSEGSENTRAFGLSSFRSRHQDLEVAPGCAALGRSGRGTSTLNPAASPSRTPARSQRITRYRLE